MESKFIAWLRARLGEHPALRLGPGDDAAIVRLGDRRECVVTTDLLTDGIDFDLASADVHQVGRKSLAVNLSDLAAMAATPLAAVIALALPRQGGMKLAQQLYEGILPLAERYGVAIAGGDTNSWDAPLAIAITLIGTLGPKGPLLRSGARPGDRILVTGALGGSILGRHFDFEPRIEEAQRLMGRYELHAGMDISDGLSIDLGRLSAESGCGAVVDLSAVPIAQAAHDLAARPDDGRTPLEHALGDGEDFELLLAVPPDEAERMLRDKPLDVPLTSIGQFVAERGLWEGRPNGSRRELAASGWEHPFD